MSEKGNKMDRLQDMIARRREHMEDRVMRRMAMDPTYRLGRDTELLQMSWTVDMLSCKLLDMQLEGKCRHAS